MIGIICAMDEEIFGMEKILKPNFCELISGINFKTGNYMGENFVLAKSGIGKVYSAVCSQIMIMKYRPKCIINIGMAGGIGSDIKILDVIIARCVIQHDYDISIFGKNKKGQINGFDVDIKCSDKLIGKASNIAKNMGLKVHIGKVLTGDSFISDIKKAEELRTEFHGIACDMECASIGQVCAMGNVEFLAIKIISDKGDNSASDAFNSFSVKYPQIINNFASKIISNLN